MEKNTTKLFREDLLKAVGITNRFIPLRPSLPVLGNLLLKTDKGLLYLSATNLETSIQIKIPVKEKGGWELTVPAKVLHEFLSNSQGKEVELEVERDTLKVKINDNQATISGIAASEFPTFPTTQNKQVLEFDQKELNSAISSVAVAASADEGKPVLTGILIKNDDGKTIVVATDGYRLSKKELKNKQNLDETLINAKTLVEVLKISTELGEEKIEMGLSAGENQVVITGENFFVTGRLLSGTYPSFKQIIPSKFESVVTVKKAELIDAIKVAAVFARDIGNVVKLEVTGKSKMQISANTAQVGQGLATINSENKGEALKVAFNSRYLLDGLANLSSETVTVNFSGVLSPALLQDPKDTSYIYIVMPVKAQN